MLQRILTGAALVIAFIPLTLFSHTALFIVFAALCSVIGVHEMLSCTSQIKQRFIAIPALIYAALGPLLSRTRFATAYGVLLSISLVFLFYLLFIHVFKSDKINTRDIAVVFMTSVYITVSFTSIVRVRDIPEFGIYLHLLIFIGACITDVFAYFGGFLFGKHKL
ncbi:MAG: phosphatidate cytidylyltransferase, partial [Clostridia bacterium]|nr:phosphatidate cytidylyltransferase [Clostridia bacterium]